MLRISTADPSPPKQVGLIRASVNATSIVERFAHMDAVCYEFGPSSFKIGDDQVQALRRAGCRRRDVLAKDDGGPGTRRRELEHAEVGTVVEVGVKPPPDLPVELLRAVDIRNGDDDHFELHIYSCCCRVVKTDFGRAQGLPPGLYYITCMECLFYWISAGTVFSDNGHFEYAQS